jgi:hypothetical protein
MSTSDEMDAPGGGKNFHHFISKELVPKIDASYKILDKLLLLEAAYSLALSITSLSNFRVNLVSMTNYIIRTNNKTIRIKKVSFIL